MQIKNVVNHKDKPVVAMKLLLVAEGQISTISKRAILSCFVLITTKLLLTYF